MGSFNEAGAGCSGIRTPKLSTIETSIRASMRPELGAPEYMIACRATGGTNEASMRPELGAPEYADSVPPMVQQTRASMRPELGAPEYRR